LGAFVEIRIEPDRRELISSALVGAHSGDDWYHVLVYDSGFIAEISDTELALQIGSHYRAVDCHRGSGQGSDASLDSRDERLTHELFRQGARVLELQ
jgi:hypothetical protein